MGKNMVAPITHFGPSPCIDLANAPAQIRIANQELRNPDSAVPMVESAIRTADRLIKRSRVRPINARSGNIATTNGRTKTKNAYRIRMTVVI